MNSADQNHEHRNNHYYGCRPGQKIDHSFAAHFLKHRGGDAFGTIKFYKRSSSSIRDFRPTHAILHRKYLLVIDELNQIAMLKVTKHLDIADPKAILGPAQVGAAIATQRAFRQ
jgi:hypothetical protein